jgi:hypothetical protein
MPASGAEEVVRDETDMKSLMREQGGWVKETRAKNYLQRGRGMGGGGGSNELSPSQVAPVRGKPQTHNEQRVSLKDRILRAAGSSSEGRQ